MSHKAPPASIRDFTRFVRKAAKRYTPLGVSTWEIWNEPNAGFWEPQPDPTRYTQLLIASHRAIKRVDPWATVITGGLAPAVDRSDGSQISPVTFLEEIYWNGGGESFDAVAIHPYCFPAMPLEPFAWNTFFNLPTIHELLKRHGDEERDVWLTEFGVPTGRSKRALSEGVQATMAVEGIRAAQEWSWVGPIFWFSYRDTADEPHAEEHNYGLVRFDYTTKQSLAAFDSVVVSNIEDGAGEGDLAGRRHE